nr:hypothetical protein [Tanacetum cinerariifolium]
MYQIDNKTTQTRAPQSPQTFRNTNPRVSTSTGVNRKTNVSRPHIRSNQMKDKVVPNNGQVKHKKTPVEDHPRIPNVSNKTKSITACNDNLNSKTSNVNVVCYTCRKCLVDSDHFACVTKMSNDTDARTKKHNVVPIRTRKPKGHVNKFIATPHKKKVALKSTTQKPMSYYRMSYKKSISRVKRSSFRSKAVPSSKGRLNLLHMDLCGPMRVASINGKKYILKKELSIKLLLLEHLNRTALSKDKARTMLSASRLPLFFWAEAIATACYTQNRSISILTHDKMAYHIINDRKPSIKHLHIFGCICYLTRDGENLDKMKEKGDPYILIGYSTQSKGYHVYNKRTRLIVESIHIRFDEIKEMSEMSISNDTSGLSSSLTINSNQQDTQLTTNIQPTSEPSTPTYVHAKENNDNQEEEEHLQDVEFTNPFCTQVQEVAESSSHNLDPEICMFALTVSTAEMKNIKEAMADSAWIEAMQEELH